MTQQSPLAVGQRAPTFSLPSSLGQRVALDDALGRGPVVLVWYVFDFGAV
jgi:peroxiredoxin